ncbi:MAG: ASCH domain-containing protein [Actinomyces sp.]|nr:ASCH domain-containing protein [Actinomyces sp.]MDN6429628.1 ASCH domain-containing protein [Propionibacterium sp.]MDN6566007.1 ASCH domain-containing protein [Actinomyces sp.]MDN6794871.1 ASCH domain-containing protein [Propionibacterium sp.]
MDIHPPAAHRPEDPIPSADAELREEEVAYSGDEAVPPDEQAVELFWEEARKASGLTRLDVVIGSSPEALVQPPAWQFGWTAHQATELVDLVLSGAKTATAGPLSDYREEDEPLPEVGELGIVCDGAGRPRALVRTDAVAVVPFDEVDEVHAAAEGEGDLSLDFWRRAHVTMLPGHQGRDIDQPWPQDVPWPSDEMVLERLTCVHPRPRRSLREVLDA